MYNTVNRKEIRQQHHGMSSILIRRANKLYFDALCKLYAEFHEFHVRGIPDRLQNPMVLDDEDLCV
jgi:hypothetical protein